MTHRRPETQTQTMTDSPADKLPDPTAQPVVIYTDGACKGNPGPGGWGAV